MSIGAFVATQMLHKSAMNRQRDFDTMQQHNSRHSNNSFGYSENFDGYERSFNTYVEPVIDKRQIIQDLENCMTHQTKEEIAYNFGVYNEENILLAAKEIGIQTDEPQLYSNVSGYTHVGSRSINVKAWYLIAMASIKHVDITCTLKTEFTYGITFMIMNIFGDNTSKLEELILANSHLSRINLLENKRDAYIDYCYKCVIYILNTIYECAEGKNQ